MRAPFLSLAAGTLTALAATGCAEQSPTGPLARPALSPLASTSSVTEVTDPASPWARIINGETGPGALYAIYVPRNPNGDAVYYAHGYRDFLSDIDLRDQDGLYAIRDMLGGKGFTVAYSSFSVNGFALKDGAQRTHQLRGLVAAELGGQPTRSFIVGHSLGGGIGLQLAEKYPDQYDGAVLMCGMVGGSRVQTQWIGNVRALVDFFYPGGFSGSILTSTGEITRAQVEAFFNPQDPATPGKIARLIAIASTKEAVLPYVPAPGFAIPTMIGSLTGALNFHSRGIDNILDITNGQMPFDNTARYTWVRGQVRWDLLPAPIAAQLPEAAVEGMVRAASDHVPLYTFGPMAENYLAHNFTPTGDLRIPVLTVHNAWDPAVPVFHQAALLAAVKAAGATDRLHQRFLAPGTGHCTVSPAQAVKAFDDLLAWIASGTKPLN